MNFKELANRITGFSIPVFGISWTPQKLEIETARRVLTFMEDRRVLYNKYENEVPIYCIKSLIEIRQFLTSELYDVKSDSELSGILRGMRIACRKFLNSIETSYFYDKEKETIDLHGMGSQIEFYNNMGELRATIGLLLCKLIIMHGLTFEKDLLKILPLETAEE